LLLTEADRARGISQAVLLEQLASAPLYFADDPSRSFGRPPEREDAVPNERNREVRE
jgi:hypothetical protein